MARSHQSLNRRERERAKKQKADDKRQRRLAKPDAEADPSATDADTATEEVEPVDEGDILRQLAELNAAFDAGDLAFDDFDEQRTALLAALTIE
jgi:hypothetical protein